MCGGLGFGYGHTYERDVEDMALGSYQGGPDCDRQECPEGEVSEFVASAEGGNQLISI